MDSPFPTRQEIEALVAYLPRLYADGFQPIVRWVDHGGTLPTPEYHEAVTAFFKAAGQPCWRDYAYNPSLAGKQLADEAFVKTADLAQIKTLLTYCVRGERFSAGHWGALVEQGHIRRLLQRLAQLSPLS